MSAPARLPNRSPVPAPIAAPGPAEPVAEPMIAPAAAPMAVPATAAPAALFVAACDGPATAAVVDEVLGNDKEGVTGVRICSTIDPHQKEELDASGYFAAIGHTPNTDFLKGQLKLNDKGYIVPGLGDAGDRLFGTK